MMDPFNPHPGSRPGADRPEERYHVPQGSGKTTVWVSAALLGGIGALILLASL